MVIYFTESQTDESQRVIGLYSQWTYSGNVFNNTLKSFKGLSISSLLSGSKNPLKQSIFGSTGGVCVIIKAMSRSLSCSVCNSHAVYGKILSSCHLMGGFYRLLSVPNIAVYISGFSCKRVWFGEFKRWCNLWLFCFMIYGASKHMKSPACGFSTHEQFTQHSRLLELKGALNHSPCLSVCFHLVVEA